MVQRTVVGKFGVRIDGVKAEKRVASFKPSSSGSSSSQNPDGKNRAADLKMKMKKSRAIQLSDFESLASSPIGKNVTLPGKPPPPTVCSNVLGIKQKKNQQPSPIRTSGGSPNYMKSTSCFDARKEVSQVGSRKSRICSDSKKPSRRNSENSAHVSVAGFKPNKCLTKCPSVKLVRTLTKTGSFKKTSRGALGADMNSHRATCSSTLRDTKFPAYLTLSPGATESEGTSTMKVCPYTYCSLNGHRHAPLPPLKCFLSARRHSLKTQKNLKVEPSGCGVQGDGAAGEKMEEALVNDGGLNFFIEIFAENKVDGAAGASSSTVDDKAESSNEDDSKPVADNISDESMDSVGIFLHGDDYDDDAGSTGTEIEEWEEQQFLSMEGDGLNELEDQSNVENKGLSEESRLHNEELVGSDVVIKDCKGAFFETEKEFNEKSGNFEEQFYMGDFKLNRHPDWEVEEASQVSESLSFDQLSYLEYAFDEMDATHAVIDRAETEYLDLILSSQLEAEVSNNEQENQDLQVDGAVLGSRASIHEEALQFDSHLPDHDRVLQEDSLDADIDIEMENGKQLDDAANHGEEVSEDDNSSEERQCQDISATGNMNSVAEQDEKTSLNYNSVLMVRIVEGKDLADSSVKAAKSPRPAMNSSQELDVFGKNWELNINYKRLGDESEDPRSFNPQEPNYLPLAPDPEAEKVDLKHQLMDDRKNAEEWMLDYALQRTVTKLTPAKKKKVALLVEAFESVMPTTSRYEPHLQNNASGAFSPEKRIQACF